MQLRSHSYGPPVLLSLCRLARDSDGARVTLLQGKVAHRQYRPTLKVQCQRNGTKLDAYNAPVPS